MLKVVRFMNLNSRMIFIPCKYRERNKRKLKIQKEVFMASLEGHEHLQI